MAIDTQQIIRKVNIVSPNSLGIVLTKKDMKTDSIFYIAENGEIDDDNKQEMILGMMDEVKGKQEFREIYRPFIRYTDKVHDVQMDVFNNIIVLFDHENVTILRYWPEIKQVSILRVVFKQAQELALLKMLDTNHVVFIYLDGTVVVYLLAEDESTWMIPRATIKLEFTEEKSPKPKFRQVILEPLKNYLAIVVNFENSTDQIHIIKFDRSKHSRLKLELFEPWVYRHVNGTELYGEVAFGPSIYKENADEYVLWFLLKQDHDRIMYKLLGLQMLPEEKKPIQVIEEPAQQWDHEVELYSSCRENTQYLYLKYPWKNTICELWFPQF